MTHSNRSKTLYYHKPRPRLFLCQKQKHSISTQSDTRHLKKKKVYTFNIKAKLLREANIVGNQTWLLVLMNRHLQHHFNQKNKLKML